jgi:hypothetical protein
LAARGIEAMKKLAVIIYLIVSQVGFAEPAEFKGYFLINSTLKQRLMKPNSTFDLSEYVKEAPPMEFGFSLMDLLGTYKGSGTSGKFKNGSPNPTNMLLWHVLLSGFAADLASTCADAQALPLQEGFQQLMGQLCLWPEESAKTESNLLSFWIFMMGYEADQHEYEIWRNFILSKYGTASSSQTLQAMTLTILNNPYFLLR